VKTGRRPNLMHHFLKSRDTSLSNWCVSKSGEIGFCYKMQHPLIPANCHASAQLQAMTYATVGAMSIRVDLLIAV